MDYVEGMVYRRCKTCKVKWNVSALAETNGAYICPVCLQKKQTKTKEMESAK